MMVGCLDEQDLEGVAVEGNVLQSGEDGIRGGATGDYEETDEKTVRTRESARHVLLPTPSTSSSEKTLPSCVSDLVDVDWGR